MATKGEFAAMAAQLEAAVPKGAAATQAGAGNLILDVMSLVAALKSGDMQAISVAFWQLMDDLHPRTNIMGKVSGFNWGALLQVLIPIIQQLLPLIIHP